MRKPPTTFARPLLAGGGPPPSGTSRRQPLATATLTATLRVAPRRAMPRRCEPTARRADLKMGRWAASHSPKHKHARRRLRGHEVMQTAVAAVRDRPLAI